jgi:SAM-dependent methyltransferase
MFSNSGYYPPYDIVKNDLFKYNASLYINMLEGITTEGKDLLDISCAKGFGLDLYSKHYKFNSLSGIDKNQEAIEYCLNSYSGVDFKVMDALDIKYENESFDIITNVDSSYQYGINNASIFYQEVKRLLRPNGVFSYSDCFPDEKRFLDHSRLFSQVDRFDLTSNILDACRKMNSELDQFSDQDKAYIKYANDDNIEAYTHGCKYIKYICYV